MSRHLAAVFLVFILAPGVPASGQTVGWRGDGSGIYSDADSPLTWGRVPKSIEELRAQAAPPQDGDTGKPIPDGIIREWLVLGPVPVPEGKKFDDDSVPMEAQLAPAAGQPCGGLTWKTLSPETSCLDFAKIFNIYGKRPKAAAYACAWLYSPSGREIAINFMHLGAGRCWLNGKPIWTYRAQGAARLRLKIVKGWNRLLFKIVADDESWYLRPILHEIPGDEYDERHIAWATHTPASGNSAPVIVGDRIFLTFESGGLCCINKADGGILWVRTTTYCDATTPDERKAHADVFKELDPLVATLREMDEAAAKDPWSQKVMDERRKVEDQLNKGMQKVDEKKYERIPRAEAGFTAPQPVSDGKNVFVAFGHGVTVSYDRDGNRRWISVESHPDVEHGYTSSPLLVDSQLLVYMGDLRALDTDTGAVVWERPRYLPNGGGRGWRSHYRFHGSGCVVDAGGVKVACFPNNEFVRLSDGKTLFVDFRNLGKSRIATPVVDDGLIYKVQDPGGGVIVIRPGSVTDDRLKPEIVRTIPFDTARFPRFYLIGYNASPLLYKGLMYCLDQDGVLTVVDVEKGEVCYQKMLDLDLFMYHSFGVGRGGAGSSPTLAGEHIYIFGNQGTCVVLEPGRAFKQVARNRLARLIRPNEGSEHQEITMTCPVFEGKRLYLRAEDHLYCIGQ